MYGLFLVAGVFAAFAIYSVWSGLVLSLLWAWFFVPSFGLPPLSIPNAIGVALVVTYMTYQYQPDGKEGKGGIESLASKFGLLALRPAVALLLGWLVKQFA